MEKCCDLHTHSVFSDGTWTPTELVREAGRIGLGAIALTDHNTVAGLPEFLAAAEGTSVEAVPGIEFSTDYEGIDLHIVGLWIPAQAYGRVTELMEEGVRAKEESNLDLCANLAKAGYTVDYPAIRDATPNGQVNRALIAQALVDGGAVSSVKEAFAKLLDPKFGFYHPPKRPDVFDIIALIKSIGAVAVMAHPYLKLDAAGVRRFLDRACPCGLDAMETNYSTFDDATTRTAIETARDYGLLRSGGSDFHGTVKPDISLGTGRGGLEVPMEFAEELRQRRFRNRKETTAGSAAAPEI